jgi:TATA-box binding protein (TBP) (component of TFIID and TFIIIB)
MYDSISSIAHDLLSNLIVLLQVANFTRGCYDFSNGTMSLKRVFWQEHRLQSSSERKNCFSKKELLFKERHKGYNMLFIRSLFFVPIYISDIHPACIWHQFPASSFRFLSFFCVNFFIMGRPIPLEEVKSTSEEEELVMPSVSLNLSSLYANRKKAERRKAMKWSGSKASLSPSIGVVEGRKRLAEYGLPANATITISNIVATVDIKCRIHLVHVALHLPNVIYKASGSVPVGQGSTKRKSTGSSAVSVELRQPKATLRIFQTGQVVCLGANSVANARLACRKLIRMLHRIGANGAKWPKASEEGAFQVQNVVGCLRVPDTQIRLELLHANSAASLDSSYEPENFPAVLQTIPDLRTKVTIFKTGTINVIGCRSEDYFYDTLLRVCPLIFGNPDKFLFPNSQTR